MQQRSRDSSDHSSAMSDSSWAVVLRRGLAGLGRLSGFEIIWKDAQGARGAGIPQWVRQHQNSCCTAVKSKRKRVRACITDDDAGVTLRAHKTARPFLKRCHAGLIELVVPVAHGNRYIGSFLAGPWRQADRSGVYADCAHEYGWLPQFSTGECLSLWRALKPLTAWMLSVRLILEGLSEEDRERVDHRIRLALSYIEGHCAEPLDAATVAEVCCLSVSRFLHLFSRSLEMTFTEYVTSVRIEQAKRLLERTLLKVSQIAVSVGYERQGYFAEVFKKTVGATPRQYRLEMHRRHQGWAMPEGYGCEGPI